MTPSTLSRRRFIQGTGVTLALPLLEGIHPTLARSTETRTPRRMLLISNNLGVLPKQFFPEASGRDYELSPYLQDLDRFRRDFTVISGLSHPDAARFHVRR